MIYALLVFCMGFLGGVSAFTIFGLTFVGSAYDHLMIITAVASFIIGISKYWKTFCVIFNAPHLLLYALLIAGNLEKNDWFIDFGVICTHIAIIWLPALLSHILKNWRLQRQKYSS